MKFNRGYRITILFYEKDAKEPNTKTLIIEPPFTLEMNIVRNTMSTSNNGSFTIHNLSESVRDKIFQDRFSIDGAFKRIQVEAGYDGELHQIFFGTIFEAHSRLAGPEILTEITSRDGYRDITTVRTSKTFAAGITTHGILDSIVSQFQIITKGVFGGKNETFQRPVVIDDNAYDAMKNLTKNNVFIDGERAYVLSNDEVIDGTVQVINADSGLLETPQRAESYLTITTLFEPQMTIGHILRLESNIAPKYNASYKILGMTHQGIISEAVSGTLVTRTNLWLPGNLSVVGD